MPKYRFTFTEEVKKEIDIVASTQEQAEDLLDGYIEDDIDNIEVEEVL